MNALFDRNKSAIIDSIKEIFFKEVILMKLKKLLSVISAFGLLCIVSPCINAQDIVFDKSDTQVYIDNNIVWIG